MTEGTARVVAPAALALFAVLGALMTDRPTPGAVAAAAVATGIGVVLRLANDAENRGVELAIVPGPPEVQRVFETAGLSDALPFRS